MDAILSVVAAVAQALADLPLPGWAKGLIAAASVAALVLKFGVGIWEKFKSPPKWVYALLKALDIFAVNSKPKAPAPKP
jgi:hypothetical protein